MNMRRASLTTGDAGDARLRRHHGHQLFNEKRLDLSTFLADPCPPSPDQPASTSSLRRHIMASLIQQHRPIEGTSHALQPVSPTSYGSSVEMAAYDPATTPTSSADFKGRIGEPNYSLKTSTQLLKVLNRIWSLEEQHASNILLIKTLKSELDQARMKIKDLVRDRQEDRHEIDDLLKQITEDKLVRKSKEHDRLHAAVQSVKNELEDERKLRRRSESLHRKLARELNEVKAFLSGALQEIEKERSARKILEGLCDEFAKGIKGYEQQVHALKHKSDKDWADKADKDRLILHISESWLDERMQMQLEEAGAGFAGKRSVVDKLSLEIETFLKAKDTSRSTDNLGARKRRNSLESVPLNETVSAPQELGDDCDSLGSDSNCFELRKPEKKSSGLHEAETREDEVLETLKSNTTDKKRQTDKSCSPPSLLVNEFDETSTGDMLKVRDRKSEAVDLTEGKSAERKHVEISTSDKSEHEPAENGEIERRNRNDELQGSYKDHFIDNLIKNQLKVSDAVKASIDNTPGDSSCSESGCRNQASPVGQSKSGIAFKGLDISEASIPDVGDNTLKTKLEARTKGRRSWLKSLKGAF